MSTINDGGPAFSFDGYGERVPVMTLRDWFASQALAGMCADPDMGSNTADAIAGSAYSLADAMLAAREVRP